MDYSRKISERQWNIPDKGELEKLALADKRIQELIGDGTVRKVIAVPGRLVNLVVK